PNLQTLIAADGRVIAERALKTEEVDLTVELALLRDLVNYPGTPSTSLEKRCSAWTVNGMLCEQIRRGEYDEPAKFRELAWQLRHLVKLKLETANPRYLAA